MSDYADEPEGQGEGPSPMSAPHRAFSSQHLQHIEMAAAREDGRSSDMDASDGPSPGQVAAAAAAARVHGLRDDNPPQ